MIKSESEVITVREEKKVRRIITCDVCGKEIENRKVLYDDPTGKHNGVYLEGKSSFRFHVSTGHHDWGNDSYESIEEKDVCSVECLNVLFEDYIKNGSDTQYFYFDIVKNPDKISGWSW